MQLLPDLKAVGSAAVIATAYHTNGPDEAHPTGDEYTVTDGDLLETLIACGFVDLAPSGPF